jgi:hypothetical protein
VVWSGGQDGTTRIGVEVAVGGVLAVVAFLVVNPSLGPSVTAFVVIVIVALDVITILALLGMFPRIRSWWQDRRARRRLNRDPILVPEMGRLVQRTRDALYENSVGSLLNMSRVFTQPEETLPNEVLRYERAFRGLLQMSQTRAPWDRSRFATLVRSVVEHFGIVQSVLDRLYTIVARAKVSEESVANWETFRERYNQLRSDWKRLSDQMLAVVGLDATVPGEPARSLTPVAIDRLRSEG